MGDQLNDDNVITLEPFVHQVGGRSTILVFGQTICKPIISRELAFYETTPTELKPFIPEFRGISEVYFSESSDGYLTITTKPPNSYIDEDNSQQNAKYRIKLCKPNGDVIENKDKPSPHGERKHAFEHSKHDLPEITNNSSTKIHNPWVLKTISALKVNHSYQRKSKYYKHFTNAKPFTHNIPNLEFLLLENLTFRFKSPCVMDLKMGVRQHDDFADDDKIKTHSLKVSNTTSGTLGLRITGVQVYNKTMDHFKCHNKYYGRTLSPEGFVETFKMFLQIENKLRSDLINLMIHKLEKMLSVVEKLDTFRFYTSSLLIIYEGNADHISKSDTNLVDIRMIDFAHTTHEGMGGHIQDNNGPDRGYIFGLTNLITILKDIESEIM